jgi:phage tail-like protein
MAMFVVNTHRFDPYRIFKFKVMWDGQYIPGINSVSPLVRKTEEILNRSGNEPSTYRVLPGLTTFEPIVLERGLTHDKSFEDWANLVYNYQGDQAMSLKNYRKDIKIDLLNLQGTIVMTYHVHRCWVSEYQALPALDANNNCVAIERLVLQHEGWERDASVTEPVET